MIYFDEISGQLSLRQHQILYYCLQGKSNQEIAEELFIEISKVKSHKTKIYQALEVKGRKELLKRYHKLLDGIDQ